MEKSKTNLKLKCGKHPLKTILYIKVRDIDQNTSIFYCEECISSVEVFMPKQFIRINEIIQQSENPIIENLLSFEDGGITIQTIKNMKEEDSNYNSFNHEKEIIDLFHEFKKKFNDKIDQIQKSAVKQLSELPQINSQIFEQFNKMQSINEFQKIYFNNDMDIQQKENEIRKLIIYLNQEKQNNSDKLLQLIKSKDTLNSFNKHISKVFDKMSGQLNDLQQDIDYSKEINLQNNTREYKINGSENLVETSSNSQYNKVQNQQINESNKTDEQILAFFKKQRGNNIDILPILQFLKSRFSITTSQQDRILQDSSNNQISFQSNQSTGCYYSNKIIEKDKVYTFRFKTKGQFCQFKIGLSREDNINFQEKHDSDRLYFSLENENNFVKINDLHNIERIKGDFYAISYDQELELIINTHFNIFWLADFPNYNHIITLKPDNLQKMHQKENFVLFIYIKQLLFQGGLLTLTAAQKIEKM